MSAGILIYVNNYLVDFRNAISCIANVINMIDAIRL